MDRRPGTCDRSGLLPVGSASLSRPRSGTAGGKAGPGRPGRSRCHPRPGGPPCQPGRGPAPFVWSRRPGRAGWGWLGPSGVCRQRGGPAPAEPLRGHGNQVGGAGRRGPPTAGGPGPTGGALTLEGDDGGGDVVKLQQDAGQRGVEHVQAAPSGSRLLCECGVEGEANAHDRGPARSCVLWGPGKRQCQHCTHFLPPFPA